MSSSKHRSSSQVVQRLMESLGPVQRACAALCIMTLIASILVACNAQNIAGYLESSDLLSTVDLPRHTHDHRDEASTQGLGVASSDATKNATTSEQAAATSTDPAYQEQAEQPRGASSTDIASLDQQEQGGQPSPNSGVHQTPSNSATPPQSNQVTVHVVIECSAAVRAGWQGDAVMFEDNISVESGMTALEVTKQLAAVSITNSQYGPYVKAINSLAEKQFGGMSGWTYTVNGAFPQFSADKYVLKDHDRLTWSYVTGQ